MVRERARSWFLASLIQNGTFLRWTFEMILWKLLSSFLSSSQKFWSKIVFFLPHRPSHGSLTLWSHLTRLLQPFGHFPVHPGLSLANLVVFFLAKDGMRPRTCTLDRTHWTRGTRWCLKWKWCSRWTRPSTSSTTLLSSRCLSPGRVARHDPSPETEQNKRLLLQNASNGW